MGQINAVQTPAHHQRTKAHRPQHFRDSHMLVGHESSIASFWKYGQTWSATRIIAAHPASHFEFDSPQMDGSLEAVYSGHWTIRADGLSMDDFGNLFGDALGNGRAAA